MNQREDKYIKQFTTRLNLHDGLRTKLPTMRIFYFLGVLVFCVVMWKWIRSVYQESKERSCKD